VRWACCQALGQLCTDLGPDLQARPRISGVSWSVGWWSIFRARFASLPPRCTVCSRSKLPGWPSSTLCGQVIPSRGASGTPIVFSLLANVYHCYLGLQEEQHARILPAYLALMDDFANPRVQAHACAAAVNFAGARLLRLRLTSRPPAICVTCSPGCFPGCINGLACGANSPASSCTLLHATTLGKLDICAAPSAAEGSDQDTLAPYLDALIGKLLALLQVRTRIRCPYRYVPGRVCLALCPDA
jgi:hypothetical protein